MWINFGEGFLLVFAVNDRESFECLEKKRDRILKLKKGQTCPIVLVGNKCDLDEKERKVKESEGKELAKNWSADYIETSAVVKYFLNYIKTDINSKECFHLLTKQIVKTSGGKDDIKSSDKIFTKKCCQKCLIY